MNENPFQAPQANVPIMPVKKHEHPKFLVATIILGSVLAVTLAFAAWSFVSYLDQKSDVDTRVKASVEAAVKAQADSDEEKRLRLEKEPNIEFSGPEDYGALSFSYPKTWSTYIYKDASSGGNYEAYLNPVAVPTISATERFALRVLIQNIDYDKAVASYSSLVKKGSLSTSSVTINEEKGTRLDGSFSKDIRGSAVLFKLRDKTLTIRTDAETFKADFDKLILTIKFNQ